MSQVACKENLALIVYLMELVKQKSEKRSIDEHFKNLEHIMGGTNGNPEEIF